MKKCRCGCGASLAGMRADAQWASRACAMRAKRSASANKARTARRRVKDGRGVKLYLLPEELDSLLLNGAHLSESVYAKVRAARDRVL